MLYIPAGHPHLADSSHDDADEISMHLTIGLGTSSFFLDHHALRFRALARAGLGADDVDDAPTDGLYWALAAPLPHIGFLARALGSTAEPLLADPVGWVAPRMLSLLRRHEPHRWAAFDDAQLLELLDLPAALATARRAANPNPNLNPSPDPGPNPNPNPNPHPGLLDGTLRLWN